MREREREREREPETKMDMSLPRMTATVSSTFPSSASLLLPHNIRNLEDGSAAGSSSSSDSLFKIPQIAVEPILNHYIEQRFGRTLIEYNVDGETPLMEAVLSRDETSIFIILFHLANVKKQNRTTTIIKMMKHDEDDKSFCCKDNYNDEAHRYIYCPILNAKSLATGQTALHLACGIFGASNRIVKMLLENGSNIYEMDALGRTPLHVACSQYGSESLVRLLLDASTVSTSTYKQKMEKMSSSSSSSSSSEDGGDDGLEEFINSLDKTGSSPLHAATRKYNTNIVNLLLRKGAKLNSFDSYGCTPLHEASMLGFDSIVSTMLLQKTTVVGGGDGTHTEEDNTTIINLKTKKGDSLTPLQLATLFGHELVVRQLLNHGACIHVTNNLGETPLHVVSCRGYTSIAKLLLEKAEEDKKKINSKSKINSNDEGYDDDDIINVQCTTNRNTPLHLAAIRDEYEMAKLLLEHGANIRLKDAYGYTPYERSIRCCSFSVARLLKLKMIEQQQQQQDLSLLEQEQQEAQNHENEAAAAAVVVVGEKRERRDNNADNNNTAATTCCDSLPNKKRRKGS